LPCTELGEAAVPYEWGFSNSTAPAIEIDPVLNRLATVKLAFDIRLKKQ
jgi:hypothetical protein